MRGCTSSTHHLIVSAPSSSSRPNNTIRKGMQLTKNSSVFSCVFISTRRHLVSCNFIQPLAQFKHQLQHYFEFVSDHRHCFSLLFYHFLVQFNSQQAHNPVRSSTQLTAAATTSQLVFRLQTSPETPQNSVQGLIISTPLLNRYRLRSVQPQLTANTIENSPSLLPARTCLKPTHLTPN